MGQLQGRVMMHGLKQRLRECRFDVYCYYILRVLVLRTNDRLLEQRKSKAKWNKLYRWAAMKPKSFLERRRWGYEEQDDQRQQSREEGIALEGPQYEAYSTQARMSMAYFLCRRTSKRRMDRLKKRGLKESAAYRLTYQKPMLLHSLVYS